MQAPAAKTASFVLLLRDARGEQGLRVIGFRV